MSISEKDIKLLWGRAAARCSFPNCQRRLTQDKNSASGNFSLGEQAHIVGENENAPRGKSPLTVNERNSYFNLILLCPTHHTIIDKNHEDYPIEKLYLMKAQHELWVEQRLSESKGRLNAHDLIYADLVDAAVESCQFDSWQKWASQAVSTTTMRWDVDAPERIDRFAEKIIGALWPNVLPELECALKKLASEVHQAIETFLQHSDVEDYGLCEVRPFPKWDSKRYQELSDEYDAWRDKCEKHIFEATKVANWLADVVRRDINPTFFATKGKFLITRGSFDRTLLLEYTEEEKKGMLRLYKKEPNQGVK